MEEPGGECVEPLSDAAPTCLRNGTAKRRRYRGMTPIRGCRGCTLAGLRGGGKIKDLHNSRFFGLDISAMISR